MTADGDTQNHSDTRNHSDGQNDRGSQTSGEAQDGNGDNPTHQPAPAAAAAGVLPNKAAEDDPRRWGDEPGGYDHDSWLEEQKPPHWG